MSKKAIYPLVYFLGYGLAIGLYAAIMASHNWSIGDSFLVKMVVIDFALLIIWALSYPVLFSFLFPEFFTRYVIEINDDPDSLFRMIKTRSIFKINPGEVISPKIVIPAMAKLLNGKLMSEEQLIQTCLVFGLKSNLQEIFFP